MPKLSRGWLLTVAVALLLGWDAQAQERPAGAKLDTKKLTRILGRPGGEVAPGGNELERLLAQRVVVAQRAYDDYARLYEQRLVKVEDVIRVCRRLWQAELALKATPQERSVVLEKAVLVEKEYVQILQQMVQQGVDSPTLLEDARYDLLTAEINLLEAKTASNTRK